MKDSSNTSANQILIFKLDELLCALTLPSIVRVIHALEVTNLPKAPEIISGIINFQGHIIPVVDIRKRFRLPEREIDPDDRVIIANTGKRNIAIFVDSVEEIRDLESNQFIGSKESLPFAEYLKGIAKVETNIILIYDLEQFISLREEQELEEAISSKVK